jgi:hypothetical protein
MRNTIKTIQIIDEKACLKFIYIFFFSTTMKFQFFPHPLWSYDTVVWQELTMLT